MAKGQRFYVRDKDGRFAHDPNAAGRPTTGHMGMPYSAEDSKEYQLAAYDVDNASDRLNAAARNETIREGDQYWQTPEGNISDQTFKRIFHGSQLEQDRYVAWINGNDQDREELADQWGDPEFAAGKIEEIDMRGHVNSIDHVDFWNDDIAREQEKTTGLTKGPKDADVDPEYRRRMDDARQHYDLATQAGIVNDTSRTGRELAWAIRHNPAAIDMVATGVNARKLTKRDADWTLNHLQHPEKNRGQAISELNLSDDMKDRILHSDDPYDRYSLALRADLTMEQKQQLFQDPDTHVRAASVQWMPREEFTAASFDPSPEVRQQVALSEYADKPTLRRLAKDNDTTVRRSVAFNERTDGETLAGLTRDPDKEVAKAALISDNTPRATVEDYLKTSPQGELRRVAAISLTARNNNTDYYTALERHSDEWKRML